MSHFDTTTTIDLDTLAPEVRRAIVSAVAKAWECSHEAVEDEGYRLYDVPVTVVANPGWYEPARLWGHPDSWHPAEGEAAEILSVKIAGVEVEHLLPRGTLYDLEAQADRDVEDADAYPY